MSVQVRPYHANFVPSSNTLLVVLNNETVGISLAGICIPAGNMVTKGKTGELENWVTLLRLQ